MPNLRLTDQEAADITAYLMTLRNPEFEAKSAPAPDTEMRQRMVAEWYAQKMTAEQAKAKAVAMSEKEQRLFLGEKYVNRYGCFGCHLIDGHEKNQGVCVELTNWGSKYVDQLDFGFLELSETNPRRTLDAEGYGTLDKIEPTRQDWATTKLMHPRVFDAGRVKKPDEKLKMPDFGLGEEDTKGLVTALLSFTKEKVDLRKMRRLDASGEEIEAGWRVIKNRNCQGCHKIGIEGGAITETVKKRFERQGIGAEDADALAVSYSPPNLQGEGGKVHPDWFFRFLKGPTTIRPWLPLRMPTFGLEDIDANAIIAHFARSDGGAFPFKYRPARSLPAAEHASAAKLMSKDYFNCLSCHMQGTTKPEGPPSGWAPDLAMARQRLQPDWIVKWLHDPQKVQPGTKMPTFYDPSDPKSSAPQDVLGGEPDTQIEVLKDYVISLGRPYSGE
jgi:mono/diheme cytochrome c family protein